MKRHNRAALAVAAIALVLPVSGCASLLSPHQTAEYQYNGGDGAWGTVGDVEVRGLLLIMDESGKGPAQLFFTLVNKGDAPAEVSVEVSGKTITETVPAGETFVQDPKSPASSTDEPVIVDSLQAKPGDLVDITVATGGQEKTIQTQVLSDVLPYYEEYVPTPSPSDMPTDEPTGSSAGEETSTGSTSTEGATTESTAPAEGTASADG
ncbi:MULTISPECIES: hypothetical protein [Brevibacterium]|uniref:Copper(I)-binding protein n=1 Tax=Brevibacterium casei CIP 102111 TaxID=1255625 RepID=A0A2H1HUB9_9MICO|nr:hypothetical protein [Brevibacterium casei]NJE67341.1 hypothetical protein [Brevibacterium sp. LS14]SII05224.1 Uncharacterised protein [Mycobacteroides abscessus subsp. abscessus]MBE4696092.1 hypothetical protein [Brevibacterium casei]MBY3579214.1 hypothetical protein [Brevibacterium casei]MDH5149835.1 hypothetical protein [Brevibacterium casei]